MRSGNLNLLESSGPPQACNGTALPLPYGQSILTEVAVSLHRLFEHVINCKQFLILCAIICVYAGPSGSAVARLLGL